MKRNNLSMLAEIEQLRRRTVRLEEGFGIEKDEALADGSRKALEALRERSRTRYQPEIRMIGGELDKISTNLIQGEEWYEEAAQAAATLRKRITEILARFIGAPSRFLRNAETVAALAPGRTGPGAAAGTHGGAPGDPDEDLLETDPPVPCPVCGATLMTDREFTFLRCPGCGAWESLAPETGGEPDGGIPEPERPDRLQGI
ncbi:MAG: hypothetical protein QUS11_04890 [Candidatus Fermentibacter sp.]|nr:hypothetical protein [Candidatus Fermentibacter sp.]